jgi:hypothetical protein
MAAHGFAQFLGALELVVVESKQVLFADFVFDFGHKTQAAESVGMNATPYAGRLLVGQKGRLVYAILAGFIAWQSRASAQAKGPERQGNRAM